MGASRTLKKPAAVAATKRALRAEARRHGRVSLQDAALQNTGGAVTFKTRPPPPSPSVERVDEIARLKARLQGLLSFTSTPDGPSEVRAPSGRALARDRRAAASAFPSSTRWILQQPKLNTVPSPGTSKAQESQLGTKPPTGCLHSNVGISDSARESHTSILSSILYGHQSGSRPAETSTPSSSASARLLRPTTAKVQEKGIHSLRKSLGLLDPDFLKEDAVFVSIDTEGSAYRLTEIGISLLDTRDITNVKPDPRASGWISAIRHHHFILDPTKIGARTQTKSLFCPSSPATSAQARASILALLSLARQPSPSEPPRTMHLVGQSIVGDLTAMKSNTGLMLDLSNSPYSNFAFDNVFDTFSLGTAAVSQGAYFGSLRLGNVARTLGVPMKYWGPSGSTVQGWHNASNDAAYTLMVLLLFAVRWPTLAQELPPPPKGLESLPAMRSTRGREAFSMDGVMTSSKAEFKQWQARKRRIALEEGMPTLPGWLGKVQKARKRRIALEERMPTLPGWLGKVQKAVYALLYGWR